MHAFEVGKGEAFTELLKLRREVYGQLDKLARLNSPRSKSTSSFHPVKDHREGGKDWSESQDGHETDMNSEMGVLGCPKAGHHQMHREMLSQAAAVVPTRVVPPRGAEGTEHVSNTSAIRSASALVYPSDTVGTPPVSSKDPGLAAFMSDMDRSKWRSNPCAEQFYQFEFNPGKLGMRAMWDTGEVTAVTGGESRRCGVEVGWFFSKIDGEPYTEALLDLKRQGDKPYTVVFAGPQTAEGDKSNPHVMSEGRLSSDALCPAGNAAYGNIPVQPAKVSFGNAV